MNRHRPNKQLIHERTQHCWSQRKVAESIGATGKQVSSWEVGEFAPSHAYQEKLCVLFGKTADQLGFIPSPDAPTTEEEEDDENEQDTQRTHSVYALCDPRTGDVRYVGRAVDVHRRYAQHLLSSSGNPKKAWLEELRERGQIPTLIILESDIDESQIANRESYWIHDHLQRGDNLTNVTIPADPAGPIPINRTARELHGVAEPMCFYTIHELAQIFHVSDDIIGGYILNGSLRASKQFNAEGERPFQWVVSETNMDIFMVRQRHKVYPKRIPNRYA